MDRNDSDVLTHPGLAWDDVQELAGRLVERLTAEHAAQPFERVVAVARGGLVPAVLVACGLGIERVETVQVRLYDGTRRLDHPVVMGPAPDPEAGRALIVDEIRDSGRTLEHVLALLPGAAAAVLVARHAAPEGIVAAAIVPDEAWVVFPWSPPEDRGEATS